MRILTPADDYDLDEWRAWLTQHGFDINDTRRVAFHDDGTITVQTMRRHPDGSAYIDLTTKAVAVDEKRFTPKTPPPSWVPAVTAALEETP